MPEFLGNDRLKAEVASPAFQQHLTSCGSRDNVDYTGVIQTKIGMLRQVFDQASFSAERQAAFDAFVAAGGDSLQQQAAFDALQAHFYARATTPGAGRSGLRQCAITTTRKWRPGWPSTNQDVAFYLYLQFLADEQLAQADARAKAAGMVMGIYRDLAVGVSEGSTEIWEPGSLLPESLGRCAARHSRPLGQNWGLPP